MFKLSEALLTYVGEQVDKIITIDVSGYGVIESLYRVARDYFGEPLALRAAKMLNKRVKSGDIVILVTGWPFPDYGFYGETDGPIGAAVLARALSLAYNVRPIVFTEEVLIPMVSATCRAASLNIVSPEVLLSHETIMNRNVAICKLPIDVNEAISLSEELIEGLSPDAIISIEKAGPNDKGVYHHGRNDSSSYTGKAGVLFDIARQANILTIGIGDRGNEIGFGSIKEQVKDILPIGRKCGCPCESGVVDATVVDSLVIAEVSNWGAYGIAACIALLTDKPEVMHDPALEQRIIRHCADAGGIDGITCMPEYRVDSMSESVQLSIVSLLKELIQLPIYKNVAPYSTPIFK